MTGAVGVGGFITGQHEAGHLFGLFGHGQGKNGEHINVIVGSCSEIGPNGLCCFAWLTSKSASCRVLFCFIDPRVRKIRNEASSLSCPGIFSRTLRFCYVASSPGSPLPHLLDGHRKLVGRSVIPARSCPGPVVDSKFSEILEHRLIFQKLFVRSHTFYF